MTAINKEKLARLAKLAEGSLYENADPAFIPFFERIQREGVETVSNAFNTLGMFRAPHSKDLAGVDIALVGLPCDLGVPNPRPGTRKGPEAVRYWSLDRNMVHYATKICPFEICNVIDFGDIEPAKDPYTLSNWLSAFEQVFIDFKANDVVPLSIGGEHTCSYPVLKGLSARGQQPLALIHLDAHADTGTDFQGTRISDATLFQCAAVDGFIDPEKTIQIGLRGRGVHRADFSHKSGMTVLYAEDVQEKGTAWVVEQIKWVVGNSPVYLSIDTDVFDCSIMPGTTLPEPFGLTGVEVRDIVRGCRSLDVVGADLMELSPAYDPTGMSSCLASGIAFEQFCVLAEARARRSGKENKTHWN
ncbi:MAG: arginase family protein [Cellvibrionaceae bacterium]|nr:arginase family protein [Cellvibrionaceae bacterium]MCV6625885.1 arginase family protein [Cellvibrionaceae bacterium]